MTRDQSFFLDLDISNEDKFHGRLENHEFLPLDRLPVADVIHKFWSEHCINVTEIAQTCRGSRSVLDREASQRYYARLSLWQMINDLLAPRVLYSRMFQAPLNSSAVLRALWKISTFPGSKIVKCVP